MRSMAHSRAFPAVPAAQAAIVGTASYRLAPRHQVARAAARRRLRQRRRTRPAAKSLATNLDGARTSSRAPFFQLASMTNALRPRDAGAGEDLLDDPRFGVGVVLRVLPGPRRQRTLRVLVQL